MAISVKPVLIDAHCHFDFEAFDDDRDALWRQCRAQGIEKLIMPGVQPSQWPALLALSRRLSGLYFGVGIHPYWVDEVGQLTPRQEQQLIETLSYEHCVAIGECGLDGSLATSIEQQLRVFEAQLRLACEYHKPLIIHAHKAHHLMIKLLANYKPPAGGVIHGFSGSLELAADYWAKGFYIGVGGTITYPRARKTRDTVSRLPLESMVLETDAPDMPLCGFQGQANSPLKLTTIASTLAQLRGESLKLVAEQTSANVHRLFFNSHSF